MGMPEILGIGADKVFAEFLGTFVLTFTVGCTSLGPTSGLGVGAVAAALTSMVYTLGPVSGAHLNPAVTFSCCLTKKTGAVQGVVYMAAQILAGICASFSYHGIYHEGVHMKPGQSFSIQQAMGVECLYTCMLCFVVLSMSSKLHKGNAYFGLAIGLVIVAGGYAAGAISGGVFNPALAFGLDISSSGKRHNKLGKSPLYALAQFVGGGIAAGLYRMIHSPEFKEEESPGNDVSLPRKIGAEMVGAFFLVLTALVSGKTASVGGAWPVAASLVSMIYAVGPVSGAHLNPAVSLAVLCSSRGKIEAKEAGMYMAAQLFAGLLAGTCFAGIFVFWLKPLDQLKLGSGAFQLHDAIAAECLFTMLLCLAVLAAATVHKPLAQKFGLVIGACVAVGGSASGAISGACLNPAVAIAKEFANVLCHNAIVHPEYLPAWVVAEFCGGAFAAAAFFAFYPKEFKGDALDSWFEE